MSATRGTQSGLGDVDIRAPLLSYVTKRQSQELAPVVIEELGLCRGQVRADVAVVGEALHGYEIKSGRDRLTRLGRQIEFYSRVFDQATLVVTGEHLEEATGILPEWWGILQATRSHARIELNPLRHAKANPSREPRYLVELLWLEDSLALLEERGAARGVRGKPRRVVWDRVCQYFELDEIAEAVRNRLRLKATMPSLA
jgi:hypothetical protein